MVALPLALVLGPLTVLFISVVFIIAAIAWLRLHAFFALIFAAMFVGLLTVAGQTGDGRFIKTIESVMVEFGKSAGTIGFTIAIASVIGVALMESGAADKIIRRFIAVLGEKRAALALLACGFVLAIPVFFDTVFFLLVPLARALSLRTGKNYMLYVLAICAGGVITHSTVPPTPGPLVVAETLKLDLGLTIVGGILFGLIPALVGLGFARWINVRLPIPVRETSGSSLASLQEVSSRREEDLPGFWAAIAPVLLPVVLISVASTMGTMRSAISPGVAQMIDFFGNKNIALLIGAVIALAVYARQKKIGIRQLGDGLGPPLEVAGVIILITAAGGAFGAMLTAAGIGPAIERMFSGISGGGGLGLLLLAFTIAAVLKVAQGSSTVAMIVASSMLGAMLSGTVIRFNPVYIATAIGSGSLIGSWMNDSGFWVFAKMGCLTEGETLRSWTPLLIVLGTTGLLVTILLSQILPLV